LLPGLRGGGHGALPRPVVGGAVRVQDGRRGSRAQRSQPRVGGGGRRSGGERRATLAASPPGRPPRTLDAMQNPPALRDPAIADPRAWSIPLATRFRGITERDGLLLHGPAGWAESSPFWDYDAAAAATWLRAALADATAERPAPLREEVAINVTIPVVPPVLAHRLATVGGATTAKVKVAEVGVSLAEDASRLEAVRDAMGPAARLRIDANAAWSREEALAA